MRFREKGHKVEWNGLEVEQINEAFYAVRPRVGCNTGICVKDGLALVLDSGYLPKAGALIGRMVQETLGCRIELLFNTHYHADHTFGNQSFDCPILSSAKCRDSMRESLSTFWTPEEIEKAKEEDSELVEEWKDLSITFPTTTFVKQKSYIFHGIHVIFRKLGGHTPGSSVAYFPDYNLLFSGDLVFGKIYPTLLTDGDPFELIVALKKILDMDVGTIVPGHGETCGKPFVELLIGYWECVISCCRERLETGSSGDKVIETITSHCHLPGIPYNEMKHRRNVNSVLHFMKEHTREQ